MDAREVRLRCIEAAARNPDPRHPEGFAVGVLAAAKVWESWIINGVAQDITRQTLSLPPAARGGPPVKSRL